MKKFFFLCAVASLAIAITSCSEQVYTLQYSDVATANTTNAVMCITPLMADLEVNMDTPIEYTQTFNNELLAADAARPKDSSYLNQLRDIVLSEAAQKNKVDVIVAPTFTISTSRNYRELTVTVHGYGAKYKNVRNMRPADIEIFNAVKTQPQAQPATTSGLLNLFGSGKGK